MADADRQADGDNGGRHVATKSGELEMLDGLGEPLAAAAGIE